MVNDNSDRPKAAPDEQATLRDELARVVEENRILRASTTWRATAPLRSLGRRMPPRLRRRLSHVAKLLWWGVSLQVPHRFVAWRRLRADRAIAVVADRPRPAPPTPRQGVDERHRASPADLFSVITVISNAEPAFVEELAEAVLGQTNCSSFEWLILDSATAHPEIRELLLHIAAQAPSVVRLERLDAGRGVLRFCLERAKNRYIVPLGCDNLPTPDALAIIGSSLQAAGFPSLAYADEDKLLDQSGREPYAKPDWDPVLFVHSCYAADLCAIDRQTALHLGAYTDPAAEIDPDWDTVLRFYLAGHTPFHVPELVRTRRVRSTAGVAHNSGVLERFTSALPQAHRFRTEFSPLFGASAGMQVLRYSGSATVIPTIALDTSGSIADLRLAIAAVALQADFIHLLSARANVGDASWRDDALSLLHAFPDAVMIGGRLHREGRIVAADTYADFEDGRRTPNAGRSLHDPGYFGQMWTPHSCDAVPIEHCVVRRNFLAETLSLLAGTEATIAGLGLWLGVRARATRQRVVYSPFIAAAVTEAASAISEQEQIAASLAFERLPALGNFLSPRLGLTRQTAYRQITQAHRERQRADAKRTRSLHYATHYAAETMARRVLTPMPPLSCRLGLLTTLYAGSKADLFLETAQSVFRQTHKPYEWIVLEEGEISSELRSALDEVGRDPCVRRFGHCGGVDHWRAAVLSRTRRRRLRRPARRR